METPFIYPLSNFFERIALRLFADWRVTGRDHVPPFGPLIVVANHQSNIDPPLLSASIPLRLRFLAKRNIFRGPVATWFLRSYGAFPLNRDGADIQAYRWTIDRLEKGEALVIFPEGTRSRGAMKKAMSGVARLALRSQTPLLPVGITGTEGLGSLLRVFNPTGRLRVNIGTVFSLPPIEGRPTPEVLDSVTDMIMYRIAALLPESYRGIYRIEPRITPRADEKGLKS